MSKESGFKHLAVLTVRNLDHDGMLPPEQTI